MEWWCGVDSVERLLRLRCAAYSAYRCVWRFYSRVTLLLFRLNLIFFSEIFIGPSLLDNCVFALFELVCSVVLAFGMNFLISLFTETRSCSSHDACMHAVY